MTRPIVFFWLVPLVFPLAWVVAADTGLSMPLDDLGDADKDTLRLLFAAAAIGYGVFVGCVYGPWLNGDKLAAWRAGRAGRGAA